MISFEFQPPQFNGGTIANDQYGGGVNEGGGWASPAFDAFGAKAEPVSQILIFENVSIKEDEAQTGKVNGVCPLKGQRKFYLENWNKLYS